jgi:hypothetical protein
MFTVTVYCHDKNKVTFRKNFATMKEAKDCVLEEAKRMLINTSIQISDAY